MNDPNAVAREMAARIKKNKDIQTALGEQKKLVSEMQSTHPYLANQNNTSTNDDDDEEEVLEPTPSDVGATADALDGDHNHTDHLLASATYELIPMAEEVLTALHKNNRSQAMTTCLFIVSAISQAQGLHAQLLDHQLAEEQNRNAVLRRELQKLGVDVEREGLLDGIYAETYVKGSVGRRFNGNESNGDGDK